MAKALSCGIVIVDDHFILACHVTGQNHWDISKGHFDQNLDVSRKACAIRETHEEIGVCLPEVFLIDLGQFKYTKYKDLHLFLYRVVDLDNLLSLGLKCYSVFPTVAYGVVPEMDGYRKVRFDNIGSYFTKSMTKVLKKVFSLQLTSK